MNIAMSLLSGVGYGGAIYFQHLIPALARIDTQNTYHLFVYEDDSLQTRIRQDNVVFHPYLWNTRSVWQRFFLEQCIFPFLLRRYAIDIVFTAKNMNIFFAPCKTIISGRNMEPFAYREYSNDWKLNVISWLKWQLTKWSAYKADHIVAVSQAVKDRFVARFPGIERKVTVVYNGNPVDHNSPRPPLTLRGEDPAIPPLRVRGGKEGLRFLLTASKFVAYANQLNLLKGYALLVEKNRDTPPLWFAGGVHDKKYFQKVQQYVEDAGLKEHVRFLGIVPHNELLSLMRSAMVFVFPSTLESCPHTLIEAMACGVPIATSNVPPMPEICVNAALYFDPQSPEDIAEKMALILSDNAARERLRTAGHRRAGDFTWDKTAQELVNVFTSVGRPPLKIRGVGGVMISSGS